MKPTRSEVEKLAKELRWLHQTTLRPIEHMMNRLVPWSKIDPDIRLAWRAVARHVLKKGKK